VDKANLHFIQAHRTSGSVMGAATAKLKSNDKVVVFWSEAEARAAAEKMNAAKGSANVHYTYGGSEMVYEDDFKAGYTFKAEG
jgi:hypothetical protein